MATPIASSTGRPLRIWGSRFRDRACALTGCACRRCASLDGDADRIVYWTPAAGGGVALFDGDRIAALAALLVRDLLDSLPADEHIPTVCFVDMLSLPHLRMAKSARTRHCGSAALCCSIEGSTATPQPLLATWAHGSMRITLVLCHGGWCTSVCLEESCKLYSGLRCQVNCADGKRQGHIARTPGGCRA